MVHHPAHCLLARIWTHLNPSVTRDVPMTTMVGDSFMTSTDSRNTIGSQSRYLIFRKKSRRTDRLLLTCICTMTCSVTREASTVFQTMPTSWPTSPSRSSAGE
uniref:Uncharacterized protein n=1 Tax=Cacopsylla melanoneura TaxID=428564 RepID=A0A8D8TA51_9HEMI